MCHRLDVPARALPIGEAITHNWKLGSSACPPHLSQFARHDWSWSTRRSTLMDRELMKTRLAQTLRAICTKDITLDARNPILQGLVVDVLTSMIVSPLEIAQVQATAQRTPAWFLARSGLFDRNENIYVPPLITGSTCGALLGMNAVYVSSAAQIRNLIWPQLNRFEDVPRNLVLTKLADALVTNAHCASGPLGSTDEQAPPRTCALDSLRPDQGRHMASTYALFQKYLDEHGAGNDASCEEMDRGTAYEPLVMALTYMVLCTQYGDEYQVEMTQTGLTISETRPWMAASPDGLIFITHRATGKRWLRGLEMKVRGHASARPIGPIPEYYWAQVQSALQIFQNEAGYNMRDYLFVSYTPDEMHLTAFDQDVGQWCERHQPTLDTIYFEEILPWFILKILDRVQYGELALKPLSVRRQTPAFVAPTPAPTTNLPLPLSPIASHNAFQFLPPSRHASLSTLVATSIANSQILDQCKLRRDGALDHSDTDPLVDSSMDKEEEEARLTGGMDYETNYAERSDTFQSAATNGAFRETDSREKRRTLSDPSTSPRMDYDTAHEILQTQWAQEMIERRRAIAKLRFGNVWNSVRRKSLGWHHHHHHHHYQRHDRSEPQTDAQMEL